MVNVPPWTSSGLSCLARARAARSFTVPASAQRGQLGRRDHGHDQAVITRRDGDPQVADGVEHDPVIGP